MRLIDADALIDKYGDWYTEEGTEEGYIGTIKGIVDSMPIIDPEPHWIPVTERLPEEDVDVLVTEDTGGMKEVRIDNCWVEEETGRTLWYVSLNVTAWMPLPEPWKGEEDA